MEKSLFSAINATFIVSATNTKNAPASTLSEVVFIGRSNVGKSTLINLLTKKKSLAKSSSTPGKTRLINYFEVECKKDEDRLKLFFLDLPGFGYAKVSKEQKSEWDKNLYSFLKERDSIKLYIHLVDSRHPNLESDIYMDKMLEGLLKGDSKKIRVYTKSDKLTKNDFVKLTRGAKDCFAVSTNDIKGIELLFDKIVRLTLGIEDESNI